MPHFLFPQYSGYRAAAASTPNTTPALTFGKARFGKGRNLRRLFRASFAHDGDEPRAAVPGQRQRRHGERAEHLYFAAYQVGDGRCGTLVGPVWSCAAPVRHSCIRAPDGRMMSGNALQAGIFSLFARSSSKRDGRKKRGETPLSICAGEAIRASRPRRPSRAAPPGVAPCAAPPPCSF